MLVLPMQLDHLNKKLFFLAGLPRSGSTLLGSILNQHNDVHVTPTSPISDFICVTELSLNNLSEQYTFDKLSLTNNIIQGIFNYAYKSIEKKIIFDKHRAWPKNLNLAQKFIKNDFKGILTYRPIPDVICSYLKLIKNDSNNFVDNHLRQDNKNLNTKNRADYLWRFYIIQPYESCLDGLKYQRDKLILISYDELILETKLILNKIENFFDIPNLNHVKLTNIENTCSEEKDNAWGLKDLHTIRSEIKKTSLDPKITLGEELYEYYSQFNLKI